MWQACRDVQGAGKYRVDRTCREPKHWCLEKLLFLSFAGLRTQVLRHLPLINIVHVFPFVLFSHSGFIYICRD